MPRIFLLLVLVILIASFPLINSKLSKNKELTPASKDYVNNLIEDYINSNPEKILNSLNAMSINNANKETKEIIKSHAAELLNRDYPSAGNPEAKVTIVEFFDYACGYCKMMSNDIKKLIEDKKVFYIFRDLPILGENSDKLARSALAIHFIDPMKYENFFHELLSRNEAVTEDSLIEIINKIGIRKEDFDNSQEKNSASITKMLDNTRKLAQNLRITGTPALVLNAERLLIGAYDLPSLRGMVDEIISEKSKK